MTTTPPTAEPGVMEALAPFREDPGRSAILLDVDGTLAPIVRHAADANVPEATRIRLIAVSKRFGLVACVSGRRAAAARGIVAIGTIAYVGNHGSETLRPGATSPEVDPAIGRWTDRVRAFGQDVYDDRLRRLRVRDEDKGPITAFHWRGAPDEAAAEAAVREVAAAAEEAGLATHWGRKVLEVRPPATMDKGVGVTNLLREADVRAALYVGDDLTDIDAFRALHELGAAGRLDVALAIGVRSDETPAEIEREADLLVDGPLGVRALLDGLLDGT